MAEEIGAWSEPIQGVQGRLITREDRIFNGTKIVAVYLELRNATNVLGSIEVYFDSNKLKTLIVDSNDDLISKPMDAAMSVFEPLPLWLVLPYDSSLRFRVSVSGYGIPKGGTAIQMMEGLLLVGPNVKQECFLEGTFVSEPEKKMSEEKWRGTIKLPKVLIPR